MNFLRSIVIETWSCMCDWKMWVLCILLIAFFPAGIVWAIYMWFSAPKPSKAEEHELNAFLDDTAAAMAEEIANNQKNV